MLAARSLSTRTLRHHVARQAVRSLASVVQPRASFDGAQDSNKLSAVMVAGLVGVLTTAGGCTVTMMEPAEKPSPNDKEKSRSRWNLLRWYRGSGPVSNDGFSDNEIPNVVRHQDVSVWKKENRVIYIVGAKNYSQASADLAGEMVRELNPSAVFVDLNEKVFMDYGLYDGFVKASKAAGIWSPDKRLNILFEPDVEGALSEIPNHVIPGGRSSSALEKFRGSDAVEDAIKSMFGKLKYAGLDSSEPKSESGAHYIQAILEGHKLDSCVVLGSRSFSVTKRRGDEAMKKTDVAAAKASMDLEWKPTLSSRENYRRVRGEIEKTFPPFHQVMFPELDAHMAAKLNKLDRFNSIVAVIMMIHVDGVENCLEEEGWQKVVVQ